VDFQAAELGGFLRVDLLHFRDSLTPINETFGWIFQAIGSISGSIGSISGSIGSISGSIGRISCLFWASFKTFG
jgi:hypothetical protein